MIISGTRVKKNQFIEGDNYPEGAQGTVLYELSNNIWVIQMDGDPDDTRLITPSFKFNKI